MQPYSREEIEALGSTELGEVSGRLLATVKLQQQRINEVLAEFATMKTFAAGWNAKGPTGPRKPLGWESVSRILLHRADDMLTFAKEWK